MLSPKALIVVGTLLILGLAGTFMLLGTDAGEAEANLARACAGLPSDRHLENALFDARAESTGGFDPICNALEEPLGESFNALSQSIDSDETAAATLVPRQEHRRRQ